MTGASSWPWQHCAYGVPMVCQWLTIINHFTLLTLRLQILVGHVCVCVGVGVGVGVVGVCVLLQVCCCKCVVCVCLCVEF